MSEDTETARRVAEAAASQWPGLFPWVAAGAASSWAFLARTVLRQRTDAVKALESKVENSFARLHDRLDDQDREIKEIKSVALTLNGAFTEHVAQDRRRRK